MPYLFDTNTFLRLAEPHSPMREAVLDAIRKLRQSGEIVLHAAGYGGVLERMHQTAFGPRRTLDIGRNGRPESPIDSPAF